MVGFNKNEFDKYLNRKHFAVAKNKSRQVRGRAVGLNKQIH